MPILVILVAGQFGEAERKIDNFQETNYENKELDICKSVERTQNLSKKRTSRK